MILKNKNAVVCGVSKRFGRSAANLLANEGANIILMSRNEELMKEVLEEIKNKGGNNTFIKCDFTDLSQVKNSVEKIAKLYSKVDILLNNPGGKYSKRQNMQDMDYSFWTEVFDTNIKSIVNITKEMIPNMKEGSSIINMSASGKTVLDSNTAYATAKTGIVGLTKNLARELRDKNIRVNCIRPGVIRNDFNTVNLEKMPSKIHRKGISEDIAHAILFFASDNSSWITGQTLVVDGGEELFLNIED